jgi:hypothetical protein
MERASGWLDGRDCFFGEFMGAFVFFFLRPANPAMRRWQVGESIDCR